ncbi:hypothetical protein A2245_03530 [candidate division WWE3 bacterium RIFOXYA2_FULL_43_12]|nr:MAG: hypothetical protein A2245_03530 [candidate division WWE3 bacterium RIFOXYA2_FULL_43_12]
MAMFENIEWSLTAEDKASSTFKKVAESQKEVSDASKKMTAENQTASSSWKNIAMGVFAGGLALDAAKKAMGFLTDQIKDGIAEASEYQRVQSQLNAVLESTDGAAGMSLQALNDLADKYSDLAVGGAESITSLETRLLAFSSITQKNFEQVTQTTLDMATSINNGVLPTAEQLTTVAGKLGKALNDPANASRVLKEAGIVLNDQQQEEIDTFEELGKRTESQNYLLTELSNTYEGRALAASNTFEGQMVKLNNTLDDTKQIIGEVLLPTLSLLAGDIVDETGKVKVNDEQMKKWQLRIYQVAMVMKGAIGTVINFGKTILAFGKLVWEVGEIQNKAWQGVWESIKNFGDLTQTVFKAVKEAFAGDFDAALNTMKEAMSKNFSAAIGNFDDLSTAAKDFGTAMLTNFDPMDEALAKIADPTEFNKMADGLKEVSKEFNNLGGGNGIGGGATGAAEDVEEAQKKINEAVQKIADDYEGARADIADALLELEEAHTESVSEIVIKLEELDAKLKETASEYQKTMAEMNKTEAERVVEQEQTIADLTKQIAEIQTGIDLTEGITSSEASQIAELEAQLAKETAAYSAYIAIRTGLDAEMTEARRRASLTDFERFIEDLNTKRTEEQAAYDERIALLQSELVEQQIALDAENLIYEQKKAMYAEVDLAFQVFHDNYLANLESMKTYTEETVGVMTTELARIVSLFQEIQAVRSSAGLAGISLGAAESGATGTTGTSTSSNITQQVTINVTSQGESASATAAEIVSEIQRQLELAGLASQ